jgi:hypothetical protein
MPANTPGGGNFGRAGSMASGFGNLLGMGGSSPGIDYDQINALLQQFGGMNVSEGRPTGLFENTGWGQSHPGFSGGLDNALIALSNMGEPSATIGGNISNVARGLSSVGPTRQAQRMAPTMMALQMAGEVAKLRQASANIGREGAMASYYGNRNQTAEDIAQSRMQVGMAKNAMLAGKEGMILANGQVGLPEVDDNGKINYVPHPEIDPKEFKRSQGRKQLAGMLGGGTEGAIIQGMLGDDPDSYASKSGKGRQAYFKDANTILLQHRTAAAGVGADSRRDVNDQNTWVRDQQTQFNNVYKGPGTAGIREKRIDTDMQQTFMAPGYKGDLASARKEAEGRAQQHQGRLQQSWSEFSLMDPDEQRQRDGIMGYLGSKGYDPTTDTFAAPRTGAAAPRPAASVMPGAQAAPNVTAPTPSPAVDALKKWLSNN